MESCIHRAVRVNSSSLHPSIPSCYALQSTGENERDDEEEEEEESEKGERNDIQHYIYICICAFMCAFHVCSGNIKYKGKDISILVGKHTNNNSAPSVFHQSVCNKLDAYNLFSICLLVYTIILDLYRRDLEKNAVITLTDGWSTLFTKTTVFFAILWDAWIFRDIMNMKISHSLSSLLLIDPFVNRGILYNM